MQAWAQSTSDKATKVVAALPRGRLAETGGRFTVNRIPSTPMGKWQARIRFSRPHRAASFAWLANPATIGSRSRYQLRYCFHHRGSWRSHRLRVDICSNRRRTPCNNLRRWFADSFPLPNSDLSSWSLPLPWIAFKMNYWGQRGNFSQVYSIPRVVTSFAGRAKRRQR